MAQHVHETEDSYQPPLLTRFKVEAEMMGLVERLRLQGLDQADIALSLADAAEDYVIRLAHKLDDKDAGEARH